MRQMAEVVYIIAAVAARLTWRAADSRYRRTHKHAFDNERKEIPLSHAQAIILKKKKRKKRCCDNACVLANGF